MLQSRIFLLITSAWLVLFSCTNDAKKAPAAPALAGQDPALVKLGELIAQSPDNDSLLYQRAKVYYNLEGYD